MKVGDKVYVSNWGGQYSTIFKYVNNTKVKVFPWNVDIKDTFKINTNFHWDRVYTPKLTLKGEPYKDGSKILVSEYPSYKDYEYCVIDKITHPNESDKIILLLESKQGCLIQIGEKDVTTLNIEEQQNLSKLVENNSMKALAKCNLNKWSIDDDLKQFPKELLKKFYDTDQNVQFGSSMTKGVITYPYIPKEYTVNNNPICLGWEVDYNGKGCDLEGKETISWNQLKSIFPENKFI